MRRILKLSLIIVTGAFLFAGALAMQRGNQVQLESRDGRYASINVRTGNDVRIVRRLSSAGCVIGRSWGFDANKIWVNNGCRAIFEYAGDRRWDPRGRWDPRDWKDDRFRGDWRRVRVESEGGRMRTLHVPNRGVNLLRQISTASCRLGRSWGFDSQGIWVDDGCRAEFEVRIR
jgi:hypothetical protein